ncbi:hypothetical protein LOTGIDRAFT_162550 [Lottia gigantea]|uniref:BTB domain-containing protein n=1 Tax=Lottia gigantea TaxID=225164 RepID=V4AC02_LOTGI|nr:hypothetical protein LOTGIDRAFT_162550 [Lottia gigantea]ESO92630.1 hypothetical protein LOTGIDRAFT_162550 [Lottia gigantea]
MESYTSSVDLTKYDQLEREDFDSDSDENHSSGYDSCDSSEFGSVKVKVNETKCRQPSSETMVFKSQESLCDSLDYILSMPELCDVVFLVGQNKTPVYGVKAILATRSRVFYQMILQKQKQAKASKKVKDDKFKGQLVLEVMNYDEDVFRRLISFIHCGKVKVDVLSVIGLFCAAVEYDTKDLKKACWDFFLRCLGNQKETLMTSLELYSHHRGIKHIMNKLYDVQQ